MQHKLKVYTAMFFATVFWGFSFIWTKQVLEFYGPITTVFLRLVLSSMLLFGIGFIIKKIERVTLKDLWKISIMAFFEPFLYFIGETIGIMHVSSTVASVIIATIPLFSPFAAYYFLGEKVSKMNLFGIIVSVTGVYLVIMKTEANSQVSILGIGLLLFAVFSAIAYSVVVTKLAHKYNVYTLIAWQNFIGMLMFLPVFLVFEYKQFKAIEVTLTQLTPLFLLAFFASSVAFMFFTYGIKKLGITKANTLANAIPVFTAFFAWILLGERLSLINILGVFTVISGLLLSQINSEKLKAFIMRQNWY